MFFRNILAAILLSTFFQSAFAQTVEKEKNKAVTDELRREAVAFLRETSAEVTALRSLENRISFASEMAGLMWFYDEKEASVMYGAVITDFKQLLADYDARITAMDLQPQELEYRGSLFNGLQDDTIRLTQKFYKAIGVRQQIAMSLAQHSPELAFNFYYDTLSIISNPELRKSVGQRDANFELQLTKEIASTDPTKAVEFGRKSISKGVGWAHVDLLKQIYEKDNAKGAEFAAEIVGKFKSDKISASNIYNVRSFLSMGSENSEKIKKGGGKKPMFSEQDLRDLAEILAQGMLENKQPKESEPDAYVNDNFYLIEKYAPARAVQLRAKFSIRPKTAPTPMVREVFTEAPMKDSESTETNGEIDNKAQKEQEETMKNVLKLKELPKEERDKIVVQARKIIGGLGSKQEKIMALSLLASQVGKTGDAELAAEILKDAQSMVNPQPKNYRDFMETWFLASAFAVADAEKAFPILEDAILRLNDTLAAFIKVGEFMDVSGEMIEDGEVQVGAFGGQMINSLTRELGIANETIRHLAVADFGKTKNLTNKFDRPEVRIMAKMLVLRAVLGDETKKPTSGVTTGGEEF
ncbi:MAG TPA: hypothetical protein VIL74_25035 [Pyrinomonadaceae bacterium]|jgi:hypothetical protein